MTSLVLVKTPVENTIGLNVGTYIDLGGWTVINRRSKHNATTFTPTNPSHVSAKEPHSMAKSPPSSPSRGGDISASLGNLEAVFARSKHIPLPYTEVSPVHENESLTSSMVHEEEEGIKHSQSRLRILPQSEVIEVSKPMYAKRRKKERHKLRKALFDKDHPPLDLSSGSLSASSEASETQEHSPTRVVSPVEA